MIIQSQNFSTERAVRFQLLKRVYVYPKHIHQFAELVIPLENELEITVDGKTETLVVGDAGFVFPFQPHSYESKTVNKLALFVFSPYIIPDFFNETKNQVGTRAVFKPRESTLNMFNDRIVNKGDFDIFDIKGCMYLILSDFLSQIEFQENSASNETAVGVVNYIQENLTESITLPSLAKALGYNPNYLSKCISEIFGMNLCTLIASIRSDKARYLLYETDKTGLEICYECGFGSERSFHRQFKAVTGRTPKEYREFIKRRGKIDRGIFKFL